MLFKNKELNIYIVSIIWGIGLAALFRKICKDKCVVIKSPQNIDSYKQKKNDNCYVFEKNTIECFN